MQIIGVANETREHIALLVEKMKIPFPLLPDEQLQVINSYGVLNPEDGLARPSVFVIDRKGIIRYAHVGKDMFDRPTVDLILAQARKVTAGSER